MGWLRRLTLSAVVLTALLSFFFIRWSSPTSEAHGAFSNVNSSTRFVNFEPTKGKNLCEEELLKAAARALFVKELQSTVAIGMLTTGRYHFRILESLKSWWNMPELADLVTIFSDSDEGVVENGRVLANTTKTTCDASYNTGLWCKDKFMFEYWKNNSRFDNVKWFVRLMDDSYVHLENLMELISKYDSSERIVLGDKFCTHYTVPYPSGGPGILFSRGLLDDFNITHWNAPFELAQRERRPIYDDVAWGDYLNLRQVPIINHMGIHQAPIAAHSPHWQYWMKFEKGLGYNWNLPYRPVLLHQHGAPMPMSYVHEKLHNISYTPLADSVISVPECKCPIGKHQKCIWDQRLTDTGRCRWGFERLECIAPGPWTLPPPPSTAQPRVAPISSS